MSLLDDTRRLAASSPFVFRPSMNHDEGDEDQCQFCQEWRKQHTPDCAWLAMPKIVAALEAIERIIDSDPNVIPHDEYPDAYAIEPDLYDELVAIMQTEAADS